MSKSAIRNPQSAIPPPPPEPPPLKQDWPLYLGWSEALEFLKSECGLRENEARRHIQGQGPKIALATDTGIGFKRWHRKVMLDYRLRLLENRVEGSDEG